MRIAREKFIADIAGYVKKYAGQYGILCHSAPPIPILFAKLVVKVFIEANTSLLFESARLDDALFHSTVFISSACIESLAAVCNFTV